MMVRKPWLSVMAGPLVVWAAACGSGENESMSPGPKTPGAVQAEDAQSNVAASPVDEAAVPSSEPIVESVVEDNFLPQLNLSVTEGFVIAAGETFFKISMAPSSELSPSQKCALKVGSSLRFQALGKVDRGHRWVKLAQPPPGCSLREGYFFDGHVRLVHHVVFVAKTTVDTRIKKRLVDSSQLDPSEYCALSAGRRVVLQSAPVDAGQSHAKVVLSASELASCGFREGYVFVPHFQDLLRGQTTAATSDFARVMKHILLWEGGCSDHPSDAGGRTFKGITTAVARREGWARDVCTMPDSMIFDIYRRGYWNPRAARYVWPLNLSVMNTEVNSGGGTAQRFLERMVAAAVGGGTTNQALWFLQQQIEYYHRIVANRPDQRVFLRGWLNRSDHMKKVIQGVPGFALAGGFVAGDPSTAQPEATAKAYGDFSGATPQ
jgi:hypothetical protein